uniref:Uncharacterized protein n=1 Tax=Megaselia scalaris TaxID=36166 RepID=T1GGK1_MEGSC
MNTLSFHHRNQSNKRGEVSKLYRQKKLRYEKEGIQKLEILREGATNGYTPSPPSATIKVENLLPKKGSS